MNEQQPPIKTGLLEFLRKSVGSQFVIPVYQRNYTWTANKEVKQYFEDLENVLVGKYIKHFMGILIYLDTPMSAFSREFSIIDGQQRLTTTFLILYAIKNLMIQSKMEMEAIQLEQQYLTNSYVPDNLKYKLKPLVADDMVYQQIVNDEIDSIKEKSSNVYKNYIWIKDRISVLLKSYSYNDILLSLDKLYVVCVPVVKTDSPQKIFESINSTGAKLVASDLIRNYILMDIDSTTQEKYYNIYWKKLEELIGNDSNKLELYFRMYLACKTQTLSNIKSVYSDFKEWYSNELETNTPEAILKDIVKYAKYYSNIYTRQIDSLDENIRESITDFRNILSDMPAPLLMEMYALYDSIDEEGNKLISSCQFNNIINLVNTYLVRRSICGLDTSDITRMFPVILKDVLRECNGSYENIVEYARKSIVNKQRGKSARMPDDNELRTYLETANVYNLRVHLRVILDKIETHNNPAPVNLKKLSVEHLMPQTPTKEWLTILNIDENTYENYVHRLGNLTLATKVDNSKMQNKPWDYKRAILEDTSHLTINKEILKKEKWGIEEITERNKSLIEQIILLYPYVPASDAVIAKHEITLEYDGAYALAYFYEEDGSVEIQIGSNTVIYDKAKEIDEWQYSLYNDLLEEGVIKESENGAIFVKSYLFTAQKSTALSVTAGLLLCGNRNGWEYWKDQKGNPLNDDLELVKRIKKKKI